MKPLLSRTVPVAKKKVDEPTRVSATGDKHYNLLERMEREADLLAQAGQSRWMIPYADLVTLLLGLFLALFTIYVPMHKETSTTAQKSPEHKAETTKKTAEKAAQKSANLVADKKAAAVEKQLKETLNLPGMEISHQKRGVVISLKDSILFSPGDAALSKSAMSTMDTLARQLHAVTGGKQMTLRVEGHTDNAPIASSRYPSNWELSTARATHIVRYLVEKRHFDPRLVSAAGYGEFRPVDNNSSIEGKRKNRRVDIVILNENFAQQEPNAAE